MREIGVENFLIFLMIVLLLPVFFAGGWFVARMDVKAAIERARRAPRELYRALEALVDGRTGAAVEALDGALRDGWDGAVKDDDRIRLGLVQGRLFRDRGECDRAIALHSELLASPELEEDVREELLGELGMDYFKAGMVDRAERQLEKLLGTSRGARAREALLEIYQQARDWKKAINIAQELSYDQRDYRLEIAQFYCELARSSLRRSQLVRAREYVQAALHENRRCDRASVILGDVEMSEGNYRQAIEAYREVEKQNGSRLVVVGERLCDAYDKLGEPERALEILQGWQRARPELNLIGLIRERAALLEGERKADELALELAGVCPELPGALMIVSIASRRAEPGAREQLRFVRDLLEAHERRSFLHVCAKCGFKARKFYWRCPACGDWETFSSNRIET